MSAIVNDPYLPQAPADGPSIAKAYPHGVKSMSQGTTVYDALKRIGTTFEQKPLDSGSPYVKPASVIYTFDGKPRRWDIVESHPSVGVVLYHTGLRAFLIVRQFRPAVYATSLRAALAAGQPPPDRFEGFTYELCAGLIDKAKSMTQICKEEIEEEVGYSVPLEKISPLCSAVSSAGTSGARHAMFVACVDDSMRATGGGGLVDHGECIEVLSLPLEHTEAFVLDDTLPKSPGLMFGLIWAYHAIKSGKLGGGEPSGSNGLLTEELVLKPVLPA